MSTDQNIESILESVKLRLRLHELIESLRRADETVELHDNLFLEEVVNRLLEEAKKKKKIDYKDAYKRWHSSKKAKRERAQRNKIRRQFEREGIVEKGDGKEIDHIVPKSKGGSDSRKNLRVVSRHTNRTKGSKMPSRRKKKNATK
jgi:5-methylcytosine-specific restriction endonuclease McrA